MGADCGEHRIVHSDHGGQGLRGAGSGNVNPARSQTIELGIDASEHVSIGDSRRQGR